jgi:hypothetical protein
MRLSCVVVAAVVGVVVVVRIYQQRSCFQARTPSQHTDQLQQHVLGIENKY